MTSRYTIGSSSYSRTRLPADEPATPTTTVADPHDPRHLPQAQQIALLTLRGGELAQACISALRAEGAPSPNELDYIALSRASLCMRYSEGRRRLTPIGKYRADELARGCGRRRRRECRSWWRSPAPASAACRRAQGAGSQGVGGDLGGAGG